MKQIIWFAVAALMLAGCSSKSNFYQMHPREIKHHSSVNTLKKMVIGVAEVDVAEYLDKPQIMTRLSSEKLKLHETERWAGGFEKNIQSVLTYDLSMMLPRYTFLARPWNEPIEDRYRIYIRIDRFDGDSNGTVTLDGRWSLVEVEERKALISEEIHLQQKGAPTIDGIVATQSSLLARVSKHIAKRLKSRLYYSPNE
jgi:uncharacterized lipoprotein YmbA